MAIPIFQIMVLKSRAVRKSWVDLLVGPGGVETVRGRVGRVNRFSNLAGRISSGQDYFEYHGSARHGSGRVKSFFNITGRVEKVSNLTDQARSDQEAMNTHGSGRVSPREKRVVFCWQADRTRGSGPRIRPLQHITVGYNNKKKKCSSVDPPGWGSFASTFRRYLAGKQPIQETDFQEAVNQWCEWP